MSIKNIIFDMGGVLIDFDPDRSLHSYFKNSDCDFVRKNTFDSEDWPLMDKGTVDVEESVQRMCARLPENLRKDAHEMITAHEKEMPPIEEMYTVVDSLKKSGYKIYLLSNCPSWFNEFKKSVPAFELFDGFIISAFYNQIKPYEDIYHSLFNKFNLVPSECFFIDDTKANIETAERLGMSVYHFKNKNIDNLKNALRKKGVTI